ncbi:hypothetical protein PRZ48_013620 [Zasmidium cellare]|uniref:Uncharacterized protein n=1 Tax=Zasmidium cellare TaxID=395010 RepID=A0ABR0E1L1_ZASCE|nr:hypothetical protein PRZ48_013620 [Zasmidium cellare]
MMRLLSFRKKAHSPKKTSGGSDLPDAARLSGTFASLTVADKEKRSDKDNMSRKQRLTTSSEEHQQPSPTTPTAEIPTDLTNAFAANMSLPRQDSFFTTPITECGPQGVPAHRTYNSDELKQLIETTTFTIDATSDIAKTWLDWVRSIGDENAAFVRQLEISVKGFEVRVSIWPPLIRGDVSRVRVEVAGGEERVHGDVVKWIYRSVEDVREKRKLLFDGGEFSRKELNKIGKTVFRVPAIVHELVGRYERGEGLWSAIRELNDESAIEDSDEEMDLGELVGGGVQKPKVQRTKAKTRAQLEKEAFIQDELAFREHARTCEVCGCQWIDTLDGTSAVHPYDVVGTGKGAKLIFEKCGSTIDVVPVSTATARTTTNNHHQ